MILVLTFYVHLGVFLVFGCIGTVSVCLTKNLCWSLTVVQLNLWGGGRLQASGRLDISKISKHTPRPIAECHHFSQVNLLPIGFYELPLKLAFSTIFPKLLLQY